LGRQTKQQDRWIWEVGQLRKGHANAAVGLSHRWDSLPALTTIAVKSPFQGMKKRELNSRQYKSCTNIERKKAMGFRNRKSPFSAPAGRRRLGKMMTKKMTEKRQH